MPRPQIQPRLLTQAQSAEYCGIGVKAFKAVCPVLPTQLRDGLQRYDRYRLDLWLDSIAPNANETPPAVDWLDKLRAVRAQK